MEKIQRKPLSPQRYAELEALLQKMDMPLALRAAHRLRLLLEEETVTTFPGERIPGWRTIPAFPDIYAPGEKEKFHAGRYIHEQGRVCNISSDWEGVLRDGLLPRRAAAQALLAQGAGDKAFLQGSVIAIDAVLAYADRYQLPGLSQAIRTGATDFLTALQTQRILHLALWASNVYHNTLGRFDQYMLPYLEQDMAQGKLDEDQALDLLEEYFLSFNRDSDMYTGMQQGDNGQSMMLGGRDTQGRTQVNRLTYLCLDASLHNRQIDPKINLRVDKNTPLELFEKCTQLTKQGLGFPQYSNDDVVIPALVRWGYRLEDACNYTVAACWEFIIPGNAMDIPNIAAICLAKVVDACIRKTLATAPSMEELLETVRRELRYEAERVTASVKNLWMEPAPWQSVLMKQCIEGGEDVSQGLVYNNYGIHGTGFADAVDQLCAVQHYVFDEKSLSGADFVAKLEAGFGEDAALLHDLRTKAPKLGREQQADALADFLMDAYADALDGIPNERGGIFRPGTGSAMYYVWHARDLGYLSNGLMPEENLSANYSPSLLLSESGPVSVIRAFARPGLVKVCNGGPLTLELHDTVFRNQEGIRKTAMLVQTFIRMGGHQLQLNAISRETLLDARKHPEKYPNLIVRVWGWSGHFVQLDTSYQDQIIARTSHQSL